MACRGVIVEAGDPVDVILVCGIGHRQRGIVRRVRRQGYDMDGDGFLYPPEDDFVPNRCVVCGLLIWRAQPHRPEALK